METRMAMDFHDRTEEEQRLHDERNDQQREMLKQMVERIFVADVEKLTQKHLAGLDAALGQAVQNVKRDSRFQYIKTSQGRHALTGPGNFYDEHHMQEYMEAVQAFLYGDIALALQKRDQFIDSFAVAP